MCCAIAATRQPTPTGSANDLGLLAEEIDIDTGEQLGNFPPAFSHVGLITAAYELDKARGEAE